MFLAPSFPANAWMNLFYDASQAANTSSAMFTLSPIPQACVSTPDTVGDNAWYPDLKATHLLTKSPSALDHISPYTGLGKVYVGNGSSLPVLHTGQTYLLTHSHPLYMRSLLFVPSITKNLLSVSKFTKNN